MSSSSGHHHATGSALREANNGNNHHSHHHSHHLQSQLSVANSQARLEQLFDEQDHKRCSEGNRKALLAENLDQLRGLAKVLEADDWKYHTSGSNGNNNSGFAWSSMSRMSSTPGDNSGGA